MSRFMRRAPSSKAVVIANSLLIALLLISLSSSYFDQKRVSVMLGNHFTAGVFFAGNLWQLVGECGIAFILFSGIVVECRRSRLAWLVNIGAPLLVMLLFVYQEAKYGNPTLSGEAEQLIIIIGVPLIAILTLYSTIYYQQSKINANASRVA